MLVLPLYCSAETCTSQLARSWKSRDGWLKQMVQTASLSWVMGEGIRIAREAMGKKAYLTSNIPIAEELTGIQTILAAHQPNFEAPWHPLS